MDSLSCNLVLLKSGDIHWHTSNSLQNCRSTNTKCVDVDLHTFNSLLKCRSTNTKCVDVDIESSNSLLNCRSTNTKCVDVDLHTFNSLLNCRSTNTKCVDVAYTPLTTCWTVDLQIQLFAKLKIILQSEFIYFFNIDLWSHDIVWCRQWGWQFKSSLFSQRSQQI
jgi:hypothetical protein